MKKILLLLLLTVSLSATTKAVVFDWGKVLATTNKKAFIDFLSDSFHLSNSEIKKLIHEAKKTTSEENFWLQYAEKKQIQLKQDWPQAFQKAIASTIQLNEEMYYLALQLKTKQIQVALLSNSNARRVDLVQKLGFYDPFNPCILSHEVGIKKPNPKIFHLLLKKIAFAPSEIVFIDDKAKNIEAAKKVGIDAIHFQSYHQINQELIKRGLLEVQ